MPGRHAGRRGRGGAKRRFFFLESSLLVLLMRDSGYGYSLTSGLAEFGFPADELDPSVIYRALRDLEERELVSGFWERESLGPPRRVYTITDAGRAMLDEWMVRLAAHRREIEALEAAYEAARGEKK